jgi:RNA polymerase sigma-70 factor (ECF subfamily)
MPFDAKAERSMESRFRRALRLVEMVSEPELEDDELCRAFLAGDESAFGELIRRYQTRVYSVVRRYAPDAEDARDLTQRAFLRAFQAARRALSRFGRNNSIPFQAWLFRIAVNLGKNHARQERRWKRAPVADVEINGPPQTSALDALVWAEASKLVRKAVLNLPRRQREVFTLRVDAELSFGEVGVALGMSENSAKVHFHYAIKRLRLVLAERVKKEEKS